VLEWVIDTNEWVIDTNEWVIDTNEWVIDTNEWVIDTNEWVIDTNIKRLDAFIPLTTQANNRTKRRGGGMRAWLSRFGECCRV